MSSITVFQPARPRSAMTTLSALDVVVARFARAHATHMSPIVGCYQCAHDEPRVPSQELRAAA